MKLFSFYLILLITTFSFGQEQKIDSIIFYLDNAKGSIAIDYFNKAINQSVEIKNDSLIRRSWIDLGIYYYSIRDTIGIIKSRDFLKTLYRNNKDSVALAKVHHLNALKFRIQNKLDSSYYYYNKSKDISLVLKDSIEVGRRFLSMARMQNGERDYTGAQATAVDALKYLEPKNEDRFTGNTYNLLGNILTSTFHFEESRKYFRKAEKKYELRKNKKDRENRKLFIINNIGYSYYVEKKYSKALEILDKGLKHPNIESEFPYVYKFILGNSASCKYDLGRKKEAWSELKKLLKLRQKEKSKYLLSRVHDNFANYFLREGKNSEALLHAKRSYIYSKQENNNLITQLSLKKLVKLTFGSESKQYFNEYVELRNRLDERESNLKEQFALVRYETEKTSKLNVGLKLKTTQQESQIESEKLQKIIFALIGILALVISVTYFRNRRKKLMYEAQLEKATAREEERQQIAKSLHDEVAGDLRLLHQKLIRTELESEAKSIEKIKDNVRNLSHQLSSESFDEVGFKDQIINLISDSFSPKFRISTEGIDTVLWETINNTIKRTLYLCVRESLQNTIKYAEATKFFMSFTSEKKEILLLLKDNGKGFEEGKGKKGIGLKNLKERVEEIHGSFHIESSEQGTKTTISIPINGR